MSSGGAKRLLIPHPPRSFFLFSCPTQDTRFTIFTACNDQLLSLSFRYHYTPATNPQALLGLLFCSLQPSQQYLPWLYFAAQGFLLSATYFPGQDLLYFPGFFSVCILVDTASGSPLHIFFSCFPMRLFDYTWTCTASKCSPSGSQQPFANQELPGPLDPSPPELDLHPAGLVPLVGRHKNDASLPWILSSVPVTV